MPPPSNVAEAGIAGEVSFYSDQLSIVGAEVKVFLQHHHLWSKRNAKNPPAWNLSAVASRSSCSGLACSVDHSESTVSSCMSALYEKQHNLREDFATRFVTRPAMLAQLQKDVERLRLNWFAVKARVALHSVDSGSAPGRSSAATAVAGSAIDAGATPIARGDGLSVEEDGTAQAAAAARR